MGRGKANGRSPSPTCRQRPTAMRLPSRRRARETAGSRTAATPGRTTPPSGSARSPSRKHPTWRGSGPTSDKAPDPSARGSCTRTSRSCSRRNAVTTGGRSGATAKGGPVSARFPRRRWHWEMRRSRRPSSSPPPGWTPPTSRAASASNRSASRARSAPCLSNTRPTRSWTSTTTTGSSARASRGPWADAPTSCATSSTRSPRRRGTSPRPRFRRTYAGWTAALSRRRRTAHVPSRSLDER